MRTGLVSLFALSTALLAASAQAGGTGLGVEEARKGIDAVNAKYMEAVAKGDAATIAGFYTDDAVVLPPDQPMIVKNKKGIEEFFKASFKAGVKSFKLETMDVERRKDVAIEIGKYTVAMQPEGKPAATGHGKYVVVWKRIKEGGWKLHRDIWNSDPAGK